MTCSVSKVRVCHVAMADVWAGAEVQLAILLRAKVYRTLVRTGENS